MEKMLPLFASPLVGIVDNYMAALACQKVLTLYICAVVAHKLGADYPRQ